MYLAVAAVQIKVLDQGQAAAVLVQVVVAVSSRTLAAALLCWRSGLVCVCCVFSMCLAGAYFAVFPFLFSFKY
jgi:hypothetical protein